MRDKLLRNLRPFIKYCIVGFSGLAIDLGVLYTLVEYVGIAVLIATTISFVVSVSSNFFLNKAWTFQNKSKDYTPLLVKFFLVYLVGLVATLGLMYLMVDIMAIWYMFAKIMISAIVVTWNFAGNKLWTFRPEEVQVSSP